MDHDEYYEELISRQKILIPESKQKAIKNAKVCVVGLGGNGGPAAEAIVRMGVENITIADPDEVEISNLNRQPYFMEEKKLKKVDCIEKRLKQINPFVKIKKFGEGLTSQNVWEVINNANVVIDAMDDYRAKVLLCRAAKKVGIPIVHTAGAGYRGSVTTFMPNSITYEEMFALPSRNRDIDQVKDDEFLEHRLKVAKVIGHGMYPPSIINKMNDKNQPWLTIITPCYVAGVLAAVEAIKIITGDIDKVIVAPKILQIDTWNNIYQIFEFDPNKKITAYY